MSVAKMQIIHISLCNKLYSNYFKISSQITYKRCIETKEYSLARVLPQTCNLVTQIVMIVIKVMTNNHESNDSNDRE